MIRRFQVAWWAAAGAVVAACGGGPPAGTTAPAAPVAQVRTAPLTRQVLSEVLTLYGTVVPGPEARHTAAVPFESVVTGIHVRTGQRVATGDPLVDVEPSPDARLSVAQARSDATAAAETLSSVRARFASRLATQADLAAAQRNAQEADLRVRSFVARGASMGSTLAAAGPSVVTAVYATEHALVPAGAPLVDLDVSEHLEVRFGVEVEDVAHVGVGAKMRVNDLGLPPRVQADAVIRAVGESVDATSRLVHLYAALPEGSGLLLGQRVAGALEIGSGPVFVVPRAALVPEPDRMVVYTVGADQVAQSHAVRVGIENDTDVEVVSAGLSEGMRVVVAGASVVSDGMHVVETSP